MNKKKLIKDMKVKVRFLEKDLDKLDQALEEDEEK